MIRVARSWCCALVSTVLAMATAAALLPAAAWAAGPVLTDQNWPDRRVWAHIIPHGLPNYSDIGSGTSNAFGDLYPLDLVQGTWRAPQRSTAGVKRALQAGVTGVQVLQFGYNRGDSFVLEWMDQADPTWRDSDPNNNFMVAPCLEVAVEADAARLIREYAAAAANRPSAARVNGKLVYYIYNTKSMTPDAWRRVRSSLGTLNNSIYMIADLGTTSSQTGYRVRTDWTTPYFSVFEANFNFDDSADRIYDELIGHLNAYGRQYAGGFMPGYDRQTCANDAQCGHIDALGTRRFRGMWERSLQAGSQWETMLTWNDMVERSEVQATSNWSITRADITAFYSAKLRRLAYPKPRAELYITSPQQIRLGEAVKAEGLVLNGSSRSVTVSTTLLDNAGRPIDTPVVSTVAPGASGDATTSASATVNAVPAGRFFRARAEVRDSQDGTLLQQVTSAPVVVYNATAQPTPSLHRLYYSVPASRALPAKPALSLSGSPVLSSTASATVTAPAGTVVRFNEVLQNTRQVANGFTANPFSVRVPMANRTIIGGQVTSATASGFYLGRVIDEQERVGYSDPIYVSSSRWRTSVRPTERVTASPSPSS